MMQKLMIGLMPHEKMVSESTATSVANAVVWAMREGSDLLLATSSSSSTPPIDSILNTFLLSEADALLMIDGMLSFSEENFTRLVYSGKDVVSGVYPQTKLLWKNLRKDSDISDTKASLLAADMTLTGDAFEGYATASYVGLGFMFLTREAVESIEDAFPQSPGGDFVFFSHSPVGNDGIPVPYGKNFCNKLIENGFNIYVDTEGPVVIAHGSMLYGK